MRQLWLVGAVLLLMAQPSTGLLITGFTPDLPGGGDDDAFEIWNPDNVDVSLSGISISDGEGELAFPEGSSIAPGQRLTVALNATSFRQAAGIDADFASPGSIKTIDAGLQMARGGDELRLLHEGTLLDAVVWGDSTHRDGWRGAGVALAGGDLRWYQRNGATDTDTSADWENPQRVFLGWRPHAAPTFAHAGTGTAYTAPDQSRAVLEDVITAATSSLRINVYDFRDADLARLILGRMRAMPALDVQVLVDAAPVGMDAEDRLLRNSILHALEEGGATVHVFQRGRYGFDHAKYVVADDRFVLVQSENFVPSGIPQDAENGNRGWGVLLDDARIASDVAELFDSDFLVEDWRARPLGAPEAETLPLAPPFRSEPRPRLAVRTARGFNVTVLAAPESNLQPDDAVLRTLDQARSTILVQHLQFPPTWRDGSGRDWPNAYLEALERAADRGVRVRVLLDGHFIEADRVGNGETALRLDPHPNIEARLWDGEGVLHVKGLVVDGRYSVVGSTNWNLNSLAQNRELSVRLDAPEFAELYTTAFDLDWERAQDDDETILPLVEPATVISAIALAVGLARRRS